MPDIALDSLPNGAWIVLGFLLDGAGPRSGYDLQAQAARSIAHFWPITKAHVYTALPRLEAAGLVEATLVVQQGLPDKRVYAATAHGQAQFHRWLVEADLGPGSLRHPLLVKTFFGAGLGRGAIIATLDRFEAQCRERLDRFRRIDERAGDMADRSSMLRRLTIRHGIVALEAELHWLAEARAAIPDDA